MLLNTDARNWMRIMPAGCVDLIVTDPPYRTISGGNSIGKDGPGIYGRPTGMLTKNDGRVFEHNDAPVETWMPLLYHVLRSPGHCYVMTNLLNLFAFRDEALRCGFKLHNLLSWHKNICTPNRWYMKDAEHILFLRKGPARAIYTPGKHMTLEHDAPRNRSHPTEKPVSLMRDMILASSRAGETVLDPFMGTGATGVAAVAEGRQFIGIETGVGYYNTAMERIRT